MARHARVISNTGIYHIMVRGINKEQVFKKDYYKTKVLEIIEKIKKEIVFSIIAYCIMDNHLHLLIKIEEDDLAKVMKRLNVTYAMYYNRLEKRYGYVFQDRFRSEAVEDEKYLLGALRYIHNNPIKAKMADNIIDYQWSSAKGYVEESSPLICHKYLEEILSLFNNKDNFVKFHSLYDNNLYLDTKEEQTDNIQSIVQNTIELYAIKNNIVNQSQVSPKLSEELAKNLLNLNIVTSRDIAGICNLSYYRVLELYNEIKKL